jgi:hypothetical protein
LGHAGSGKLRSNYTPEAFGYVLDLMFADLHTPEGWTIGVDIINREYD